MINDKSAVIDFESIYSTMANGSIVFILNSLDECIQLKSNENNGNNDNNGKPKQKIIMYGGLCKTNQTINDLQTNNISYVVAFNVREIKMLELKKITYLIKIKRSECDIGVNKENLIEMLSAEPALNYFRGICMTLSKKIIIDYIFVTEGKHVSPFSKKIYRIMNELVVSIITSVQKTKIDLNFFVIDIQNENNISDNFNQSNVMFKLSIFNYLRMIGYNDIIVT